MKKYEKYLSLRIQEELFLKFRHIAKHNERSMNNLLLRIIRKCIAEFEDKNGKI